MINKRLKIKLKHTLLLGAMVVFLFMNKVEAADFGTALSIATFNIPDGADSAAMGNADASAWGWSSNNPAMTAFSNPQTDSRFGSSVSYGIIDFNKGPKVSLYSVGGTVKTSVGFFQTTVSYFGSNERMTKMGVNGEFAPSKSLELIWANKIAENVFNKGDELYVGAETSFSTSKMNFSLSEQRLIQSKSTGNDLILGFLYKPSEKINIGGFYGRYWDRSRETDFLLKKSASESSTSNQFKIGASYQLLPTTFIACDYQFLNMPGAKKSQLFTGFEQEIFKDIFYLYGGWANRGLTSGIGIYFNHGGFNAAYMENPFSETREYLGRAKLLMAMIYLNF